MENYTHLSLDERQHLYTLRQQGMAISQIAKQLNRHRSTLYRELVRHQNEKGYHPIQADKHALATRTQARQCKIEMHSTLRQYVMQRLRMSWSPEQITGRLKRKKSKYVICHETIYRFIYRHPNKKLFTLLARKKPNRRRHFARKPQVCRFGNNRIITARPSYIAERFHYGHWEGDRIEFIGERSSAVTTLVERKTRVVLLIKNDTKKSAQVMRDIIEKFNHTSPRVCKTFTFDQGSEFSQFAILENGLNCTVYYCHSHAPWEKGSNENMNGRIRRHLPFQSKIEQISQEVLDQLSNKLNNTPRKCLGYKTPKELFLRHYKSDCRTWF